MVAEQIKLLRQIQHLVLIREENSNVGTGDRTDDLSAEIARLASCLEPATDAIYRRISAKARIFVSPLSKGNCSACGMKIPTSVLQHVLSADTLVVCGTCGRILYVPSAKATGVRMGEPDPKFLLSRFSTAKLMVPKLAATTKEAAIAELCGVLTREKVITDPDAVVRSALEREEILSTAVGNGLAFPHMRGIEEGFLTFACGVSPSGIAWDEDHVVNLVLFTVLPVVASPFYLKLLGAFASSFEDGERLPFVLAAGDAKTLWKTLNKVTRTAVKNM